MNYTLSKLNTFLFLKLPAAFWSGVRVKSISKQQCEATVKHRWFNQNPFNSMYFAVQAMAAELTTGALVMMQIKNSKKKISMLAETHAYKQFNDLIDVDAISVQPMFQFLESIAPSENAPAIPKSLYVTEASIGIFEARVIMEVASIESIKWWHRNLSKGKGFRINGFINHYADFIVKTKSGRIIVLEVKGDDKDNTDSENKLKLGKLWEAKVGAKFKYMMVFDHKPIEGAETLADALRKIGQL